MTRIASNRVNMKPQLVKRLRGVAERLGWSLSSCMRIAMTKYARRYNVLLSGGERPTVTRGVRVGEADCVTVTFPHNWSSRLELLAEMHPTIDRIVDLWRQAALTWVAAQERTLHREAREAEDHDDDRTDDR